MNDEFKILFELLEDRGHEVMGREASTIPAELRARLARFAAGSCTEDEREQMKRLLLEQPDLIRMLVGETLALRAPKS